MVLLLFKHALQNVLPLVLRYLLFSKANLSKRRLENTADDTTLRSGFVRSLVKIVCVHAPSSVNANGLRFTLLVTPPYPRLNQSKFRNIHITNQLSTIAPCLSILTATSSGPNFAVRHRPMDATLPLCFGSLSSSSTSC